MVTTLRSVGFWLIAGVVTVLASVAVLVGVPLTLPLDRTRRVAHMVARLWCRSLLAVNPAWRFALTGLENVGPGPYVVVGNHESNMDPVLVFTLPITIKAMGKVSVFFVPFLGWAALAAGFVPVRRGNRTSHVAALAGVERWVRSGVSVLLFPEGTRTRDGSIGPFKKGAFELARRTGVPVLPLTLSGTRSALPKGSWRFGGRTTFRLHVDPPVSPGDYPDWESFAAHVRDGIVRRRAEFDAERVGG